MVVWLCAYPSLCRGDWVLALFLSLLYRGDCVLGLCLSLLCKGDCDWVLALCLISLVKRWLSFGFVPCSSCVEVTVVWFCSYPSCVEVVVFERGAVYSKCRVVIPRWRFLWGRSCVDIVEILLCEGEDVEQWLEPRDISCCFTFDPLSLNSISLISYIALFSTYSFARYSLCVSTLCWIKRVSYNTLTLNLEESRGVVPEPFTKNSASLLVTHSVLQLSFKFQIICPRLANTPIHPL